MTRNVKRFLAASLFSLAPSIALAGPAEAGDLGFPFQLHGYVSAREEGIQVPSRKGASEFMGPAVQDYYNLNLYSSGIYQFYIGTDVPFPYTPNPVLSNNWGGFRVMPSLPGAQTYYWTTNPAAPAVGPTCLWQVVYSFNNGVCQAVLNQATHGGAICTFDGAQSFVDSSTCSAQIVTYFQ